MSNTFKLSRRSFVLSAVALAACKPGSALLELTGKTMGTHYNIVAVDHGGSAEKSQVQAAVDASLARINTLMSNWDAGSEVSRFNAARSTDPMAISKELAAVVQAAEDVHKQSDGYFDITLGPVIEAWGFGAPAGLGSAPGTAKIAGALAHTGQDKLTVSGAYLQKSDPATQMYLSSIGKGYGVDHVAAAVAALGFKDFMVEIGGDLYVSGLNADAVSWKIGIESPDLLSGEVADVAKASNLGMATSGDYRNFFEEDGTRFSHIIDPKTGRPVTHSTASVTVLAENAMLADAWATGLLAMGAARGMELADDLQIAALFIDRDAAGSHIKQASTAFAALQT
ncbi:MAG: FAD:protein FMN transferase [Pseudomonadota bacterium]